MGNTKNAYGKPVYDDIYSFPQDSQDAVDFADEFANVRRLTSADRQSLTAVKQRPGMMVTESDKGALYRSDGAGGWGVLATVGGAQFASASGFTYVSVAGGVTVTFPAGRFSVQPAVVATVNNAGVVLVPLITNLTATSFFLRVYTLASVATTATVAWVATQKTATAVGE